MNYRTVLMSGAAALALTSNAWAAQGDTYLSLFGGYSTLTDTDILHYNLASASEKVTSFRLRGNFATHSIPNVFTSQTPVVTDSVVRSITRIGTMLRTYKLTDSHTFRGTVGTDGWVIGAALGVELFQGLRAEAEIAFRRFDMESDAVLESASLNRRRFRVDGYYNYLFPINYGTAATATLTAVSKNFLGSVTVADLTVTHSVTNAPAVAEGELTAFSFMANLWYDLPLGDTGLVPFIGGGIGIANLTLDHRMRSASPVVNNRLDRLGTITITPTTGPSYTVSPTTVLSTTTTVISTERKEDDAVFAYQFGAGLGYQFNSGVRLSAQYRYFATTDGDFGSSEANVESSDIIFGLSFPFGQR